MPREIGLSVIFKGEVMRDKNVKRAIKKTPKPLDESTLTPHAKELLDTLSKELNLPKEVIAHIARSLYRSYKGKA